MATRYGNRCVPPVVTTAPQHAGSGGDSPKSVARASSAAGEEARETNRLNRLQPSDIAALGLGLFTYGTLTIDSMMHALLDRVPPSEATSAPGWRAADQSGMEDYLSRCVEWRREWEEGQKASST
ncbi:hypothetical protein QBC35DRAFT_469790 [Podospora australis]|uniref:Uncharacterized protein n=1 Tax=Podospora australis TaxID=1536484 RepID=A0AAN6X220_9PEZI|nr:hypothetical protein QBC35DRAFT_469790 [Podospora australis]